MLVPTPTRTNRSLEYLTTVYDELSGETENVSGFTSLDTAPGWDNVPIDPKEAYRLSEEVTKELFTICRLLWNTERIQVKLVCDMFVCLLRVEDPGEGVQGEDLSRKHWTTANWARSVQSIHEEVGAGGQFSMLSVASQNRQLITSSITAHYIDHHPKLASSKKKLLTISLPSLRCLLFLTDLSVLLRFHGTIRPAWFC